MPFFSTFFLHKENARGGKPTASDKLYFILHKTFSVSSKKKTILSKGLVEQTHTQKSVAEKIICCNLPVSHIKEKLIFGPLARYYVAKVTA